MSEESWFYADSNQQQQGPISFGEIQQLAASGTIQPSTLIWKEGMASWTAASEVQGVYANPGTQTPGPPAQIPEIPSNPYEAPGGARTSPGKAVGFMFIPFFSLYWIFVCYHGWAQDWNRIRNSHSNLTSMPTVSEGLFMAGPICMLASIVPFIGFLSALAGGIIILIMLFNICKVVNAMADASQQPN